jgi:hypothetical protein
MHHFKLALAAGASIIVATEFSPAYALPPMVPLDLNGPIRQGHACIAPYGHRGDTPYGNGQYYDTGPGYNYFYDCGPQHAAHHARQADRHHRGHRDLVVARAEPFVAIRPAVYRPLDLNGPIRQGDMCIAPYGPRNDPYGNGQYYDTGPGYTHFELCPPHVLLAGYHGHRHAHAHHHRHAHHAQMHHRKHNHHARHQYRHAQYQFSLSCDSAVEEALPEIQQFWQPTFGADAIDTIAYVIDASGIAPSDAALVGAEFSAVNSAGGEGGAIVGAQPPDGGLLARLFAADTTMPIELAWTRVAQGSEVTHSMPREADSGRRIKLPLSTGDRPAPIAPALALVNARDRMSEPQWRQREPRPDQIALTGVGYSSPVSSDADAGMPVTTRVIGVSPIAAVLGLALIAAAPLALVAAKLTVADRAAVVETVSDVVTGSEGYIPAARAVIVDQRTASAAPAILAAWSGAKGAAVD